MKPTPEMIVAAYLKKHEAMEMAIHVPDDVLSRYAVKAISGDSYSANFKQLMAAFMDNIDWTKVKDELVRDTLAKVAEGV